MSLIDCWGLNEAFRRATLGTPFISHLSSASLPQENFDAWLYNDFVYARSWNYLIARIILSLPSTDDHPSSSEAHELLKGLTDALLKGFEVAQQEIVVFKSKASHRGLPLPHIPDVSSDYKLEAAKSQGQVYSELSSVEGIDASCRTYVEWMQIKLLSKSADGLHDEYHWTTSLAALWMMEKVYCEAMWAVKLGSGFDKLDESTKDFIGWWAKEEFKEYVGYLEGVVATVREGGWGWREEEAKYAVKEVLKLEEGFWSIAEEGLQS